MSREFKLINNGARRQRVGMEIKMSEVGGIRDGVRCGKRRDKVNGWWEARGKYICVYIYIYIYI